MIVQQIENVPFFDLSRRIGLPRRRYRSTWPTFETIELVPGLNVTSVSGDDSSLAWMPDHLSDRLRYAGVRVLGASGVMLPAKVPADGADLYEGPIRRAFVDGIVRGLRYVDGRTTSEIGPAQLAIYPDLTAAEIARAVTA